MAIKTNEREYRAFSAFNLSESEDGKYIEGYAAVFESPTTLYEYDGIEYKEQIKRGAFDATDMKDVILNYDHEGKVIARTRNKTLELMIDETGLKVRARLDGTQEGRNLYEEVIGGYLDKMSFAFTVEEALYNEQTRTRTITKIKRLYDVSVVSIPAYNDTSVSARSHFQAVAENERKSLERESLRKKLLVKTYL